MYIRAMIPLPNQMMKLGAAGVISTAGNVAPGRMKEITDLCAGQVTLKRQRKHTMLSCL